MIYARTFPSNPVVYRLVNLPLAFVNLGQISVNLLAASICQSGISHYFQSFMGHFQNDASICPSFCQSGKLALGFNGLFQNDRLTFSHSPYGRERCLTAFSLPTVEGVGAGHVPARFQNFSIFPIHHRQELRR